MKKKITLFLVIVLGVIGVGSGVWLSKSYAACQLAQEALITDDNITVENGDYISFTPKNKEVTKGYIFYLPFQLDDILALLASCLAHSCLCLAWFSALNLIACSIADFCSLNALFCIIPL